MATAIREDEFPDLSYEADLCGNIEQALKALQGYGIMALELIQNADDAGAATLRIDARDDALVVENDAEFNRCSLSGSVCDWSTGLVPESKGSRSCNFHAITRMGGRAKLGQENQTGRFGIGFVSVYQVTDTPVVRSVGVEYTLNPRDGRARRRSVAERGGTEFVLPWAFANSPVRQAIHQNVVPEDVADKVVDAIATILPDSVLFLRNLKRMEVRRAGVLKASVDVSRTDTGVDLLIGPGNDVQRWIVQSRDAEDVVRELNLRERFPGLAELRRSTVVSVAVPIDVEVEDGLLYAYLPTRRSTGLPLHVNADFFPHASRQEIVLGSESQESFWNEAMLAAAAETVGERLELLKTTLGHRRLWRLGEASRQLAAKDKAFACFWEAFSARARECDSVWVMDGGWRRPAAVRFAPASVSEAEQASLAGFGLNMLDPSLREFLNALTPAGVSALRITDVAAALTSSGPDRIATGNPHLRPVWSALDGMLEQRNFLPAAQAANERLLADIPFLLDWTGSPVSPGGAWRLPDNVPADLLEAVAPDVPVVHPDVQRFPNLLKLVDRFDLDAFATLLARLVPDEDAAASLLGASEKVQRTVYRLLVLLREPDRATRAQAILWNVPFLRKADGRYTTPARGLLPGEFRDPTGWFEFVDVALFPPGMSNFAEEVLGVCVMEFTEFVSDHLADAIERGLTRDQYKVLMAEIADHRHQLDDVLDELAQVPFVRNRADQFVTPGDCYFFDAEVEAVLGAHPGLWVDFTWLPSDPDRQKRLRDFLEAKLGMPTQVAAEHVVERVEEIAEQATPEVAKRQLTRIFRHVLDRWGRLDAGYREQLAALSDVAFLPGQIDGKPDEETLYRPDEVFRAGRAPGFSTQVPVVDLAPLRENRKVVNELLDLIGVEELPETSVVVDHLLACMEAGRDPHPLTYQILGERCEEGDRLDEIDRLQGLPCIYDPTHGYLRASTVFWSEPPIQRHWHKAHPKMSERPSLFARLGVTAAPGPANYAELALGIAAAPPVSPDGVVHARCLRYLADALWHGHDGAAEAVEELASEESLLTLSDASMWPADVFWVDSEQHLAPFGRDLDDIVAMPPADCDVAALRRLYAGLGARPLSEHVRLELAREPGGAVEPQATDTLRERSGLLLRLAPTQDARAELQRLLGGITIHLAPSLRTRAELDHDGVTLKSDAVEAEAFVDRSQPAIYLTGARVRWVVLARHLFDAVARLCPTHDMRSLAGTATTVLQASSLEDAHEIMEDLNYAERSADEEVWDKGASSDGADGWWSEGDAYQADGGGDEDLGDPSGEGAEPGAEASGGGSAGRSGGEPAGRADAAGDGGSGSDATAGPGPGEDDPYTSKAGGGGIGEEPGAASGPSAGAGAGSTGSSGEGGHQPGATQRSGTPEKGDPKSRSERFERRKKRQSRFNTYVASEDYESPERGEDEGDHVDEDRTGEIGKAAVAAVLAYERFQGRTPEEMPHHNPGYDVVSAETSGGRRLIEVKGTDGEWDAGGVKLSRFQFRFAQDHPDEFWLYVVEHALDPQRRLVRPVRNPFARVDSFFFDSEWRKASEAVASSAEMLVRVGAKVDDWRWGVGVIVELSGHGIGRQAKVRFPIHGLKPIPVHKLNIVD